MDAYREKQRAELAELNLKTKEDLENLVKPLIKEATKIICKESSESLENSHLSSHFGGQPYFEKGEEWPKGEDSIDNCDLEFVFQIFNEEGLQLPDNIKLLQFFYDFEGYTSVMFEGGWFIKIYETINPENYLFIEKPKEHNTVKYCEMEFKTIKSLPDWDGIDAYCENAKKLSCVLGEKKPWENYEKIAKKLVGKSNFGSQLGGYGSWIQNNGNPRTKLNNGEWGFDENYALLFQLASEEEPDLMWGDNGLVYVFYNKSTKEIKGEWQCY
ncbi:MAG: DUF1963 domain-containing protein [Treponema sp.]|jgi:uncharacterized protein YwqG|nr:DUF1963 domain-containing protein [Treponema sp.]